MSEGTREYFGKANANAGQRLHEVKPFMFLLRAGKGERRRLVLGLLSLIVASGFTMASATLLGLVVQRVLTEPDLAPAYLLAAGVLSCEILSIFVAYFGRRQITTAALGAVLAIRSALFAKLEVLPLSYFDRTPQGRIITRVTNDVESLEDFFSGTLSKIVGASITAVAALSAMLIDTPYLGGLVIVGIAPAVILTVWTRKPMHKLGRELVRQNSHLNSTLAENIQGIEILRLFGLEKWSQRQYRTAVGHYQEVALSQNSFVSLTRPLIGSLSTLPLILIAWYSSSAIVAGSLGVATLVSFIRYFERFGRPLMDLSMELHVVQQAFAAAERVYGVLNEKEEDDLLPSSGDLSAKNIAGKIEIRSVRMTYPGWTTPALQDISFTVEPGKRVALIGASGSGKSSTVALLMRLYEFQSGEILIDGKSVREFNRQSLRKAIGFVSQEVMLMRGSIRENLDIERRFEAEKIEHLSQITGLYAVLARNGKSLDYPVTERGANLSMGERQLVSITRMLLRDPRIVILDEATAHIDPVLEAEIDRAISILARGRTVLVIAHRLGTISGCDTAIVFDKGRVIDQGSHLEQLVGSERYKRLWEEGGRH